MLCLVAFTSIDSHAEDQKPVYVHFIVLPKVLPGGGDSESAYKTFQAEMIMLAGGFSELGNSRGGSMHSDGVAPRSNAAYIVSADKDISKQIKDVVQRLFGLERVFILVWQGHLIR